MKFNAEEFYPTPVTMVEKMLAGVNFRLRNLSVLEPSAGKGDILEYITKRINHANDRYRDDEQPENLDIDVIEKDPDLQLVLRGKGYRVVHDDFLTYTSLRKYSLIAMNPPFSEGAAHLRKALSLLAPGGFLVCLLNAETLLNLCTNERKVLMKELDALEAEITYFDSAFHTSERPTDVQIAMVRLTAPEAQEHSIIVDALKRARERKGLNSEPTAMVGTDFTEALIQRFALESEAGIALIHEFKAMRPYILDSFRDTEQSADPILSLRVNEKNCDENTEDAYLCSLRMKYWSALFASKEFMSMFTSNLREEYSGKVGEMANYDFTAYNIAVLKLEMSKHLIAGVEETILALFDEMSQKHAWYDEGSTNVHYYNGWATNKAHIINKKVILPINGFGRYDSRYDPTGYYVERKLGDVEKVFNFLDAGRTDGQVLHQQLAAAAASGCTRKIPLKYFDVTFYKKGTCHIEFRDLDLLKKFNIFGSQHKGWLPPSYGRKQYTGMNAEERRVVDEFEGEQSYAQTIGHADYFLPETCKLLCLPQVG